MPRFVSVPRPFVSARPMVEMIRAPSLAAPPPTQVISAPIASSNGITPLLILPGQVARLLVTAEVAKGALAAGAKFNGTVVLKGKTVRTVTLQGNYLGTLMGSVTVQPQTVVPGQPVLVQVLDSLGKPLSDPSVAVTIQGVPASARYYQFPTVGSRKLIIRATRGALSETIQATVVVAGKALAFRPSLTIPVVTEIPMLQVAAVMGQPYAATFTLGTTAGLRRAFARAVAKNAAGPPPRTAVVAPPPQTQAPTDVLGTELTKRLTTLPVEKILRIAPTATKTATGIATSSAVLAAIGGLEIAPTATSYQWDFGDGQTLTTQAPTATHDYFPAIQAEKIAHSFNVTCTIVHENLTIKQTLVLHSAYGLCKRLGTIVPPVTGPDYATFQQVGFSASLIVHNLEAFDITLNNMACVPLSDDGSAQLPAPTFTTMQNPVIVAANSASALGVYVSLSELQLNGAVANGFTVYYTGAMQSSDGSSVPVRFSYAFRIPLSDSGMANSLLHVVLPPSSWDFGSALQAVTGVATQAAGSVSKAGGQTIDPATKTVAIALSANPQELTTLVQVRSAIQAGLTDVALKTGALTAKGVTLRAPQLTPIPLKPLSAPHIAMLFDPLNPPVVAPGNQCYPDDISDADAATASAQQLVCQLTGQPQTETIMGSFQNAQAGDIILSPVPVGSGDLIAAMFSALTPSQHHGHSGIMTANFFEITHCTASVTRISAAANLNYDAVGIPTSPNGNMLQYAWPGSLTQSVDDASSTVNLNDPSGTPYPLNSFDPSPLGEGLEIIPPWSSSLLPENEAAFRPLLRKVADTARSKGAQYDSNGNLVKQGGCYYSFYAYTNPQLSAGFTDPAPDAGWAKGLSPAVCSSFVWLCLKENNLPAVTPNQFEKLSDFSPMAVAGGAQVGPATLDGLFFYPQAERLQGAEALYQTFMNQALSQEDGLGTIPGVNEAIAGPIADQLLNAFAFGNPNLVGSSAWKNPGNGNAVSPDNMIWWNPPCYGYAEPLQYLPRHTEQYTTSTWVKVVTWGSIKGTVRLGSAPVANAHVWVYLPGGDTHTGADGSYTLNHIGIGSYNLKAQAVITQNGLSVEYTNTTGQPITLSAANADIVQDIELQGNPQPYRRLDITYSISCDHGDDNPFNTHGVQNAGPYFYSLYVNPGQVTSSMTHTYDYDGGGYFHIDYTFTIALLQDFSIEVTLVGTMSADGSGNVQDQYGINPFNVPMGESRSGSTSMEHSNGYHNGPAIFTFSATNNLQTG